MTPAAEGATPPSPGSATPRSPGPSIPEKPMSVGRAAGIISIATFLSRIMGLIREQVFAAQFGAGFAVDAFQVAFRVPNLLRDLFAEGAMSAAFVPTLTKAQQAGGPQAAMRLANLVMNFLLVVVSGICLVGIIGAPWIVRILAPGFGAIPGKLALTTLMTQIMTPYLLIVSIAASVMGVLNTRRIFFIPAVAPVLFNLGLIVAGYAIAPLMPRFGLEPIVGMAFGALLGGLGQLAIQLPALAAQGFRWRPILSFRDPGVLRVATLMAPASVGLAAVQVNVFTSTFLASTLREGSVSWLNYAYRLMQLPIGLFGVAIATVTLAEVSRHAAERNMIDLKATLRLSLRLVLFLTLPATFLLIAMAGPIVALLYQHGRFSAADTVQTSHALWAYAVGLAAFSGVRVMVPVFYSLGMARVPVTISMITIAVTVVLYFVLMGPLQHAGLALATSIGSVINFTLLFLALRKRVGVMGGRLLAAAAARIVTAAALAAGAAWSAATALERSGFGHGGVPGRALVVTAGLAAATVVYLAAATVLKIPEMKSVAETAARLMGGGRKRG
jgi:putative peptidoglycan lipid II flippase